MACFCRAAGKFTKDKVRIMNLPNALTVLRILMVPAFAWCYFHLAPVAALAVYLLASLTDFLDGYLARKLNQITDIGKLMDPLADKLMLVTLLVCLAYTGHVMWWVVGVMFVKELYMLIGSLYMLRHDVVVFANIWGKAATGVFIVALALVFPWHEVSAISAIGGALVYAAVALSLLSMVIYTKDALQTLRARRTDC